MARKLLLAFLIVGIAGTSQAEQTAPPAGRVVIPSAKSFDKLVAALDEAVAANGMGVVACASASQGAAARGIRIPGNAVVMVFRNDYAVRMLAASVPAGIEAPLRYYVTENAGGTSTLTYRKPSAVFAPYRNVELDQMAAELDPIFENIAQGAVR
ncbi:MAG: DUF302 domain-containing protein [Magnetospirillum sp.]|nr:DUF302 domain-containing protein [Magnetospirillum sp.]